MICYIILYSLKVQEAVFYCEYSSNCLKGVKYDVQFHNTAQAHALLLLYNGYYKLNIYILNCYF